MLVYAAIRDRRIEIAIRGMIKRDPGISAEQRLVLGSDFHGLRLRFRLQGDLDVTLGRDRLATHG